MFWKIRVLQYILLQTINQNLFKNTQDKFSFVKLLDKGLIIGLACKLILSFAMS